MTESCHTYEGVSPPQKAMTLFSSILAADLPVVPILTATAALAASTSPPSQPPMVCLRLHTHSHCVTQTQAQTQTQTHVHK